MAIIQSGRLVPYGVTCWASGDTRPSMLVVVPAFSPNAAAASTTSASCVDSDGNVSTEMIRRAPASARRARSASGQSLIGSAPSEHEQVELAVGGGPQRGEPVVVGVGRREADRQRADDVAATERRQHGGLRAGRRGASAARRSVAAAGTARFWRPTTITTGPLANCSAISASANAVDTAAVRRARFVAHRLPGVLRQPGLDRGELDDLAALLLRRVAQAQEQDGQLLLQVGAEQDDRRGVGRVVDRRPRQSEHLGREPVAELGVAVLDTHARRRAAPRRTHPRSIRGRHRAGRCRPAPPSPSPRG